MGANITHDLAVSLGSGLDPQCRQQRARWRAGVTAVAEDRVQPSVDQMGEDQIDNGPRVVALGFFGCHYAPHPSVWVRVSRQVYDVPAILVRVRAASSDISPREGTPTSQYETARQDHRQLG